MMSAMDARLAPLDADEIAFLSAPAVVEDDFPARLGTALAATLSARLRLPVALEVCHADAGATAARPAWHVDDALAMLWLARRLGGQDTGGRAPFVPKSLLTTLDAVLAERWLDRAGAGPAALAWRLSAPGCEATLGLVLPRISHDMTRWARETIATCA